MIRVCVSNGCEKDVKLNIWKALERWLRKNQDVAEAVIQSTNLIGRKKHEGARIDIPTRMRA